MYFKIVLLLAILTVCSTAQHHIQQDLQYLAGILENVPVEARRQFLIHQLYLGYVLTHPNDEIFPIPTEVTLKLYQLFLRNFIKSPVEPQLMALVCFPSGECVDTEDPGIIP